MTETRPARRGRACLAAALLAVAALIASCSTSVRGTGRSGLPPLAADSNLSVIGDANTSFDRLARNALSDVFDFWRTAYPSVSGGKTLPELEGGIYSVDDHDITSEDSTNACLSQDPKQVQNNAFFCELDDSIAYDRVGFIPDLVKKYGDYFVALLFGHEFGHAIQDRLGTINELPSIVKETQADCAAGAFTGWVLKFKSPHIRVSPTALDKVLVGYIQLRDPDPHSAADEDTHGDGFDRLSALATGINEGITACYSADWKGRPFTERPFTQDSDYASNGNEPEDQVINAGTPDQGGGGLQPDLNAFWKQAAKSIGKAWSDVKITAASHPRCAAQATSEFGYCPEDNTVYFSQNIADKAYAAGDYALGTLFVYGWGLAVRRHLFGRSVDDEDALIAAGCYAGAYSKSINRDAQPNEQRFLLSPGDMDEASVAVLTMVGSPLAFGDRGSTGLDRIDSFTKGYFGGLSAC